MTKYTKTKLKRKAQEAKAFSFAEQVGKRAAANLPVGWKLRGNHTDVIITDEIGMDYSLTVKELLEAKLDPVAAVHALLLEEQIANQLELDLAV